MARDPSEQRGGRVIRYDDGAALVGAIMGDIDAERRWGQVIGASSVEVQERTKGLDLPVRLQVELHVPGRNFEPEFRGVRAGRFLSRSRTLAIQARVDAALLDRGRAGLIQVLDAAVDEAERSLLAKRLEGDLGELRRCLAGL